jgi:hypothetical protein
VEGQGILTKIISPPNKIPFGNNWFCMSVMRSNFSKCIRFSAFKRRFSKLSSPFICLASWAFTAPVNDLSVCSAIFNNSENLLIPTKIDFFKNIEIENLFTGSSSTFIKTIS